MSDIDDVLMVATDALLSGASKAEVDAMLTESGVDPSAVTGTMVVQGEHVVFKLVMATPPEPAKRVIDSPALAKYLKGFIR